MRTKEEYQRALDFMQGKNICASCGSSNCDKCLNVIYKNMLQELIDNYNDVSYLCDREKCDNCSADRTDGCSCKHTLDIKHAKNFKYIEESNCYEEIESTKETPMKPQKIGYKDIDIFTKKIIENYEYHLEDYGYHCRNCNCLVSRTQNYCPNCGQKLDWST